MKYERLSKQELEQNGGLVLHNNVEFTSSFDTHWHEFYEMELIRAGSCAYVINGKPYRARAGDLFFLTPVDFHSVHMDDGPVSLFNLNFDGQRMNSTLLFSLLRTGAKQTTFSGEALAAVESLFLLLERECAQEGRYRAEAVRALLDAIAVNVCRQLEERRPRDPDEAAHPAQRAALYMQLHFQEPLRLEEIAAHTGRSAAYLSDLFHRHMGVTVKAYLTELRLSYAAKMLTFSDLSVTDICYASGFGDFSCFWRAFSARFGCPPRAFRTAALNALPDGDSGSVTDQTVP